MKKTIKSWISRLKAGDLFKGGFLPTTALFGRLREKVSSLSFLGTLLLWFIPTVLIMGVIFWYKMVKHPPGHPLNESQSLANSASKASGASVHLKIPLQPEPLKEEDFTFVAKAMEERYMLRSVKDSSPAHVFIIVTQAGLSQALFNLAFKELPPTIAYSFSPYAENIVQNISKLHQENRISLLEVPLEEESLTEKDSGSLTLVRGQVEENNIKLNKLFNLLPSSQKRPIVGMVGQGGGAFLTSAKDTAFLLKALKDRNLIYVELKQNLRSRAPALCQQGKVHCLVMDFTLTGNEPKILTRRTFQAAQTLAKETGYVYVAVALTPFLFDELKGWISTLPKEEFILQMLPLPIEEK